MSNIYEKAEAKNIIGAFTSDKNTEFYEGVRSVMESVSSSMDLNMVFDAALVLRSQQASDIVKNGLMEDVQESALVDDAYQSMVPAKLEQLFENSVDEILTEASNTGQLAPIVGLSLPILKKNYLEMHAKDIVMTEIPDAPIIKHAFERKFVKDRVGNKHYVPEIFYGDGYKDVLTKTIGKEVDDTFQTLPQLDFNILTASGGSLETRDSLSADFHIKAVKVTVAGEEVLVDNLFIQGEKSNKGGFNAQITAKNAAGTDTVTALLSGAIDFQTGKVSVSATDAAVTAVQFGGHLSNENNMDTVEMDFERELMTWEIPDGARINTGITLERIKDTKALFKIDLINKMVGDMTDFLTQMEDSTIMSFLDDSMDRWRDRYDLPFGYTDGFTETYEFSAVPTTQITIPTAQYVDQQLKYNLNREIDQLKKKLRTNDIMFVLYGNPSAVSLIQDGVKWVIDENTKVGGVTLDYSFGVMYANKNRVHVVSSMKTDESKGLRIVAFPTSSEQFTFKHYKYSMNVDNTYRNPFTPLTNNVMATSRYLTKEVTPVQGEFLITNADFGRKTKAKP